MTNPVIDCLMGHRTIRKFQARPLAPEVLDCLLQAAVRAATASGLQQYSLIVVDEAAKKRALWDNPAVDQATAIVAVVDQYRLRRWLELNGAPFHFDRLWSLFLGLWDAHIALHNLVVAAEGLGLGGVYIGGVQAADLAHILGTPRHVFAAGMVCLGYPDEAPELRPRLPLPAVVHHNTYRIPDDDDIRRAFAAADRRWQEQAEEQRQRWAEQGVTNRAQALIAGNYPPEYAVRRSRAIRDHLLQAGYRIDEE